MSTLRSGLDELRGQDVRLLSETELEDELAELDAATRAIAVERARRVAEVERRGSFGADGHLSLASWVESRFGTTHAEAAREVRLARGLEHMPAVCQALADGEVSPSAMAPLLDAREANPKAFGEAEELLLEAARTLPVRELRKAVERWKSAVEPDVVGREDVERFDRRGLHASPSFDGMVRVDGNLDPDTGNTLLTALSAVMGDWARSAEHDPRSPAQRRADALGEVCRGWLDRSDRPVVAGERPHITVVVDAAVLARGARDRREASEAGDAGVAGRAETSEESNAGTGSRSETSEGIRLGVEAARRLACDASIARVITSGRSEPLEVGRATRVVGPALRRALRVRDGGCAFPVCDRPASWCDAHHVRHWADGGRTDLGNLVLLCRRHHTMTHGVFAVEMRNGRPVFRRPDGTVVAGRGARRAPP